MRLNDALIANERYRGEPTTDDEGRTQWPLCMLWDDELQGFGVRIFPPVRGKPSRKDFIVTWKVGLKSRTMAIGTHGVDCTLRQARTHGARSARPGASRTGPDRGPPTRVGDRHDRGSGQPLPVRAHRGEEEACGGADDAGGGWRSHRRWSSRGRSDAGDRGPGDDRHFGSGRFGSGRLRQQPRRRKLLRKPRAKASPRCLSHRRRRQPWRRRRRTG